MPKMKIIYEPKGRAREYADLALNVFNGCVHGCRYCFNQRWAKEAYFRDPNLKKNVLENVEHDAWILSESGDDREILLSFVGDVYQPNSHDGLVRNILAILIKYERPFTILSKGGGRATVDFDLLGAYGKARYGVTLVLHESADVAKWEPAAASYSHRVMSLLAARERGIRTWVSLEPVIDPAQALRIIEWNFPLVDFWKVGKINTDSVPASDDGKELARIEKAVDWIQFREDAVALLKKAGARYYIKKSLADL